MKKIYALAAMALMSVAPLSAKELTFYQGTTPIENGSKILFEEVELYDYTNEKNEEVTDVTYDPFIFIESDYTGSVTITANSTSGQPIQLCTAVGTEGFGQCVSGTSIKKAGVMVSPGKKVNLFFDYIGTFPVGSPIPVVVVDLTATDDINPAVKTSFTITMDGSSAGATEVIANDNAFLPVAGGIEYSFDAPTQVAIFTLAGEAVVETSLNGNGTLSTANLPAGVYVYKAGEKAGKIYLR